MHSQEWSEVLVLRVSHDQRKRIWNSEVQCSLPSPALLICLVSSIASVLCAKGTALCGRIVNGLPRGPEVQAYQREWRCLSLVSTVNVMAFDRSGADAGIPRADLGSVKQILTKQISCFSAGPFSAAVVLYWSDLGFPFLFIPEYLALIPSFIRAAENTVFL